MNSISRRKFFAGAGAITALAALPTPSAGDSAPGSEWAAGDVENTSFRLSLSPREGLKNTRLLHLFERTDPGGCGLQLFVWAPYIRGEPDGQVR